MTGIDQEKLEDLIERNKIYIENINDCSKKICLLLTELNNDYIGKTLDDMYFSVVDAVDSLNNIDNILNGYVACLDSVKKSYILQDMSFGQQISYKN